MGFKWMTNQGHDANHDAAKAYLLKRGMKLIFLWRRNSLRQLISNKVNKALDDGFAHPTDPARVAFARSVAVELQEGERLVRDIRKLEDRRKRVSGYYAPDVDSLTVYYEDVVASSPSFNVSWAKIFDFLGVDATYPHPRRNLLL